MTQHGVCCARFIVRVFYLLSLTYLRHRGTPRGYIGHVIQQAYLNMTVFFKQTCWIGVSRNSFTALSMDTLIV